MYSHKRLRLFNPQAGDALALDQVQFHTDHRFRFGSRAGELSIALAGMYVAQVEESPAMIDRQEQPVAGAGVADVQIASPVALAVHAGRDLAFGGDAEGAEER